MQLLGFAVMAHRRSFLNIYFQSKFVKQNGAQSRAQWLLGVLGGAEGGLAGG